MRKFLLFAGLICADIGFANAAVRSTDSVTRQTAAATTASAARTGTDGTTATRGTTGVATRSARTVNTSGRTAQSVRTVQSALSARTAQTTARTAASASGRTATAPALSARSAGRTTQSSRAAKTTPRAATISAAASNTFGTGYNACRDAYFTCMDQFCAKQDDTYRRCVCSSRLNDIKSRERLLGQTSNQILDFKNLNLDVIPKTGAEVKAMMNATVGEAAASAAKDKSDSAQKLAGISEVLSGTKTKALSTQGTLDIAGDINAIWATTDLAGGASIANLTGDALYNAVHSQCVDLISNKCSSQSTLSMVVSAYAMYIENDCTALSNALDKQFIAANAAVRETEYEMQNARLENYDAHNSTAINDCIAQVRKDITADTACGENYVHCLDISGRYLNKDTGEPIYTAEFYQLENATSLTGDVLTNQTNRLIVAELNRKRMFAERGLDTCRDMADEVWDEFLRQAITEIYQGQHARIRQVKEECLDVVNKCYDERSQSLKDFSNIKEQLLLGSRLELSEELCREKLMLCSNLYNGMEEMVAAMKAITDQKIAKECKASLRDYALEMCSVSSNDSTHAYPYGCRTYVPGTQYYATLNNGKCNSVLSTSGAKNQGDANTGSKKAPQRSSPVRKSAESGGYICPIIKYTSCSKNYYMTKTSDESDTDFYGTPTPGNTCRPCLDNHVCEGGTEPPVEIPPDFGECGTYPGSLYQKLVRYAQSTCVRPSESSNPLPSSVLQDVNSVMDTIRTDMAKSLAAECQRMDGVWVDAPYNSTKQSNNVPPRELHKEFYDETGASNEWGYCIQQDKSQDNAQDNSQNSSQGTQESPDQLACTESCGTWDSATSTCSCKNSKLGNGELEGNKCNFNTARSIELAACVNKCATRGGRKTFTYDCNGYTCICNE